MTPPVERPEVLRVECCVCHVVLVEGTPGALTSHTYCPNCLDVAMAEVDALPVGTV